MTEPHEMRVSDADRHRVAEVLREAAGEGRLDLDELSDRLEAAYAAKVYADLVPLLVDLPTGQLDLAGGSLPVRPPSTSTTPGTLPPVRYDSSIAIMGAQDRKGVWQVGPTHTAFAMMAGVDLDLREAVFTAPEVVITAVAVMGGIDIVVDAHTQVVIDGIGIMGAFEQARDRVAPEVGPGSPVVRVKGLALMGGVTVVRKPQPGEKGQGRRWLLGR